jgi:hypothetical protein
MALVHGLELITLERDVRHSDAECTYAIVATQHHGKQLQIDTYGSQERKLKGKKSQSIRLTANAIQQLKRILADSF